MKPVERQSFPYLICRPPRGGRGLKPMHPDHVQVEMLVAPHAGGVD